MLKAPPISKDVIAYLESVFANQVTWATPEAEPHVIAANVHRHMGHIEVIGHLKAVFENQQNEDPANVSKDTEAT